MGKLRFLSIVCLAIFTSSCKQEVLVQDVADRVNNELSKTKYGQYIPSIPTSNNQATSTSIPTNKECLANFYQNQAPLVGESLRYKAHQLCFNGFVVLYSGISKTPLWSAELLTKQRVQQARKMQRVDNFHEETRIPIGIRSKLSDYSQTGYDRGHLSPNADMPNVASQFDSFSLANIAPQNPELNRGEWSNIESNIRKMVMRYGDAYVVTGTGFVGQNIKVLKGNVMVPTYFYKAIYFPKTNTSIAYLAKNNSGSIVEQTNIKTVNKLLGINIFPTLN